MAKIITVSRQFGSGGRELGKRLSDLLGWDYYDREIIQTLSAEHLHDRSGKLLSRDADAGDGEAAVGKIGAEADEKQMAGIGDSRCETCGADGVDDNMTERVGAAFEGEACAFFDAAGEAAAER